MCTAYVIGTGVGKSQFLQKFFWKSSHEMSNLSHGLPARSLCLFAPPSPMATVIISGGIIGTAVAFYLSQSSDNPSSIHVTESAPRLFASASGYAGGFLAKD